MFELTPTEKRTVSILVCIICGAGIIQVLKPMTIRPDEYDYARADSIFERRSRDSEQPYSDSGNPVPRPESVALTPGKTVTLHYQQNTVPLPASGSIDLNRATVAELESLPHIGPAMAARIVEYRKNAGTFNSVNELKKVKGIGEKIFKAVRPFLKEIK
jgi:competence ComEA-like helix-hairpin-helix protein